jgi:hypothetical protein
MKLIRIIVACFLSLISFPAFAGGEQQPIGARRLSLGNAYTAVKGDYWAMYANPAGLVGMKEMKAGVFVERRFLLNQLNHGAAGFAMPFKERHAAGIQFSGFGFGDYSDANVALAYAGQVIEQLSLGVRVNYKRTSIANYGAQGALVIDAGLNALLAKGLTVGFSVSNTNQARLKKDIDEQIPDEQIPTTLDFGLAYQASDKVLVVLDLQKQVNFAYSFRGGVEYAILPILTARVGVSTAPVTMNAGLGLKIKQLELDISNSYHELIGYTPALSLSYKFGKKEEAAK